MRTTRLALCFTAATATVACNQGGGAANSHGQSAGSADGGSQMASGGSSGGGTHPGTDAGVGAGDGGGSGGGQFAVTLQNVGRHGDTLLLTVHGADPAGQTTEVHARLLDTSNTPVVAFDTDWNGSPDSAEQRLHFDQSTLGQKTFTQTITLPGLYGSFPNIGAAAVALSDVHGKLSPEVTATLTQQSVVKLGVPCDPNVLTNRCAEGLACGGMPPTCLDGVAPSLKQVAYFGGANPVELFLGNDPDEDLATLNIAFLDANGKPTKFDVGGDNAPLPSITLDVRGTPGATFFYENDPVQAFASAVPKISVTATDLAGRSGMPVIASVATQVQHSAGGSCDPHGFVGCTAGNACSPGIAGAMNACASVSSLQMAKCTAAPQASTGNLTAGWGLVQGASLWDPPDGCALPSAVGRPESVVMLKLAQAVSTLTVSTATPETDFDTILYVLPGCASSSNAALGCNDDAQGYSSTVTLTNVAAGTYAIVVDSVDAQGGHFGLSVTAQ
jgi:hypothetical protein